MVAFAAAPHSIAQPAGSAPSISDLLHAECSALPDAELLPVPSEVVALTARLRNQLPELSALETDLPSRAAQPGQRRVERIEHCSSALLDVHQRCLRLQAQLPSPSALAAELAKLRQRLLGSATALVAAGALAPSSVEPHRQFRDLRSLAQTACGLASVLLTHWQHIRAEIPLELTHLERALELARQLSLPARSTQSAGAELSRALRERQQLFTLLVKEYAALRRAAQHAYGKEEALRRVPSLYGKPPSRRPRPRF